MSSSHSEPEAGATADESHWRAISFLFLKKKPDLPIDIDTPEKGAISQYQLSIDGHSPHFTPKNDPLVGMAPHRRFFFAALSPLQHAIAKTISPPSTVVFRPSSAVAPSSPFAQPTKGS